ncbi:succinate dehydrogenase, hydrophobic membrane anchor protein [Rhodobacteraceae bacterium 63075]|nr:succinate dehydrogenase, hydrophobic membrane anchor protein [Rhodobacteraceae bacterium 63075]
MRYLTARKRAEGKGSAGHGAEHHWFMQVSAVALALLTPFFIFIVGRALGAGHDEVLALFQRPWPVLVIGLMLVVGLIHARSGAQTMIEDYLQGGRRKAAIIFVTVLVYLLIATTLYALAKLAL